MKLFKKTRKHFDKLRQIKEERGLARTLVHDVGETLRDMGLREGKYTALGVMVAVLGTYSGSSLHTGEINPIKAFKGVSDEIREELESYLNKPTYKIQLETGE